MPAAYRIIGKSKSSIVRLEWNLSCRQFWPGVDTPNARIVHRFTQILLYHWMTITRLRVFKVVTLNINAGRQTRGRESRPDLASVYHSFDKRHNLNVHSWLYIYIYYVREYDVNARCTTIVVGYRVRRRREARYAIVKRTFKILGWESFVIFRRQQN